MIFTPQSPAACPNAGDFGSSPDPISKNIPRRARTLPVIDGVAAPTLGSGKSGSPCPRMQRAKITARARWFADIVPGAGNLGRYRLQAC
jgi:hypothetical protein